MFSWYQKFAAMPMLKRLMFGVPVAIACFLVAIKLTVLLWVDLAVQAVSEENRIEYESTFFRLNGDFGMNGFKLVHLFPDGTEGPTYLADRLVIHTPGFFWLWKGAFSDPEYVPDNIGLTAENLRDASRTDETPGNYTNLPYDAIGCGVSLLTPAHLRAMGLHSARNTSLNLRQLDDANSILLFEAVTPGLGQLQMNFSVTVPRPLGWSEILVAMFAAQASDISMSMKDQGFIKVRNDFCASKAGVSADGFSDFHMRKLAERFAEDNGRVNPGTLARYREFARDGGELTLSSVNAKPMNLMQFVALGRYQKMHAMTVAIRHDNGSATEFSLEAGPAIGQQVAGSPTIAAATPAPAATAAAQVPEGVLQYAQLKSMVGAHVQFLTMNGTQRRGTLMSYSPYMSVLKLDPGEGGFTLSVPADSITQVISMPLAASPAGDQSGQANAKTN